MQARVAARASGPRASGSMRSALPCSVVGCSRPFANVFHFHPSKKPEGYV